MNDTDSGNESLTVSLAASSSDTDYEGKTVAVSVTVTDDDSPNSVPAFDEGISTSRSMPENTTTGTNIGEPVEAMDADSGDTLTYSLNGADASSFSLDTSSGQLQTKAGVSYDFETKVNYGVSVRVHDGKDPEGNPDANIDDGIIVAINITNVNEQPTITSGPSARSFAENTATTEILGEYSASDPDEATTLTWSLRGGDAGDFTITKNAAGDGELTFKNVPNYEMPADSGTNNAYDVRVRVTDNGIPENRISSSHLSATQDVSISVTNVDEDGTVSISGTAQGGSTLTASVSDEDGAVSGTTWQWARGNTAGGSFSNISGATSASYTLVAADVGKYLRATASYTDPQGSGKSAEGVSGQVGAGNSEPTFGLHDAQ